MVLVLRLKEDQAAAASANDTTSGEGTSTAAKKDGTPTVAQNRSKSNKSKKGSADQSLSAAEVLPTEDPSMQLGEGSAADAFLVSGTVNRSAALGGPGSFGSGGGLAGFSNSDAFGSISKDSPFPGQDSGSQGGGRKGGKSGRSRSARSQRRQAKQLPAGANAFGEGIEELWAEHRLAKLASNTLRFSFYNRYDNAVWDARPYSLTQANPLKLDHFDEQIGTHFGGPLYIPHIYDGRQRTFFFVRYERERAAQPLDFFSTVPTLSERNGDFSDRGLLLFDPTSSLTGPRTALGSQIPESRLDKAAMGLLPFIPQPNVPGFVQNYHLQSLLPAHNDRVGFKILHTVSPKLNLALNYNASISNVQNASTLPQLTSRTSGLGQSVTLTLSQSWSPRVLSESKINWSRNANDTLNGFAYKNNVVGALGLQGVSVDPIDWGVPGVHFANFTDLNDTVPALRRNQTLRFMNSLSYTLAQHTLRTGAEVRWIQINTDSNAIPRGNFAFTGLMTSQLDTQGQPVAGTGFDFADFLMGFAQSTKVRYGDPSMYLRSREYIGYAQDDWRIHPRFALTLGVRYELMSPPVERYDRLANLALSPDLTQGFVVTPGIANPFTGKTEPRALLNTNVENWAPRIGLAWRPQSKLPLVIRAGYSIFYNESIYNQLSASMINEPPFAEAQTRLTTAADVLTLENGFPAVNKGKLKNAIAVDPNYRVGYAQLWNYSMESQLKPSLVLEMTYTGTKGTHLDMLRAPNRAPPGSPLLTDLKRRIHNADGFAYDTFGASSTYHAVQTALRRQMAHGLMMQGIYTFGKSIDNASSIGGGQQVVVQNDNNFRAERGLSSFDIRQQFRGTFSYELPFGQKKNWLHSGFGAALLGNLQASGQTMITTGTPFTALLQGSTSDRSGTGSNFSTRADQIGDPNLPGGLSTPLRFFNTAAFAIPPALQFGDAGRNTITGPGGFVVNLALTKKLRFGQDGRVHTDIRWEVQNVANTPNFLGLNTYVDSAPFGHVQSVKPMRVMDLMLRVNF